MPQADMSADSAPIIIVDHTTLADWIESGLVSMLNIGDIQFNGKETKGRNQKR